MPKLDPLGTFARGLDKSLKAAAREARRAENARFREIERQRREVARESQRLERERIKTVKAQEKKQGLNFATQQTEKAQHLRQKLINLLADYNFYKSAFNWLDFKSFLKFSENRPSPEYNKQKKELPPKPNKSEYEVKETLFLKLFPKFRLKRENKARELFKTNLQEWKSLKENYTTYNQRLKNKDNQRQKKWEDRKAEFLFKQEEKNKKIDKLFLSYKNCETEGITFFIDKIILKLELPVDIKVDWEVTTDTENKIVLIDFRLPNKEFIPKTKSVKYYVTKKEFSETFITEKEIDRIYDLFIIQLSLIVQNTIYTADSENAIDSIVFNGWVNTIEKASGHPKTFCIISLQTKKDELKKINLALVEPKACFKQLKGIAANKLSDLIPVAPILEINKEDKRFVESEGISKKLEGENIAAMHWEKFEHLIRELFEKEFSSNGGEVKITQTSHDGGVDAIAFDPDPLKGGKIVIQAKRYTNVVSVSAVRDLYGTVMNEGANKGILVTTSNYGPDAYNFAKDKPLTLLNGSNLLHLLEKHGYSCRIDINEAKKILKNN